VIGKETVISLIETKADPTFSAWHTRQLATHIAFASLPWPPFGKVVNAVTMHVFHWRFLLPLSFSRLCALLSRTTPLVTAISRGDHLAQTLCNGGFETVKAERSLTFH